MLESRIYEGPRFIGCHQTVTTGFIGQASFNATTPTLILDNAATRSLVIVRMTASQFVAGGADVTMLLATDIGGARYASGGAAVATINSDRTSSKPVTATLYGEDPVAGAATAGVYYFGHRLIDNVIGLPGVIDFPDGIVVPPSGSFLAYFYCGTSDAKLGITLEWLEV